MQPFLGTFGGNFISEISVKNSVFKIDLIPMSSHAASVLPLLIC